MKDIWILIRAKLKRQPTVLLVKQGDAIRTSISIEGNPRTVMAFLSCLTDVGLKLVESLDPEAHLRFTKYMTDKAAAEEALEEAKRAVGGA